MDNVHLIRRIGVSRDIILRQQKNLHHARDTTTKPIVKRAPTPTHAGGIQTTLMDAAKHFLTHRPRPIAILEERIV